MVGRPIFKVAANVPSALLVMSGDTAMTSATTDFVSTAARHYGGLPHHFDWGSLPALVYLFVAGWFLLRLAAGTALSWRLQRAAQPIHADWTMGRDVRSSPAIKAPGTFCSTILLPEHYGTWNALDRRAILVHEDAHVRWGDFYLLLLAAITRAVFWFNPLVWWLNRQIVYLAETRSDAAAIEDIGDRIHYAELLVRLGHGSHESTSLAMARSETVARRVEYLLAETRPPRRVDWKTRAAIIACVVPLIAIATGVAAQVTSPQKADSGTMTPDADTVSKRRAEQAQPRTEVPIDTRILDNYIGYFQLSPALIFTVTRQGDQFFAQLTGQRPVQFFPESSTKFFAKIVHAQISFVTASGGRATALILHQNGFEQSANRIDKAEADSAAEQLAKRKRDGIAQPGSEAALRHTIASLQAAQPNYDEMVPALAEATRQQLPNLTHSLEQLGQLQSIAFVGVGNAGWDTYEVRFANGVSVWRVNMAPDGKIGGMLFQAGP
jgi:hypothetical protein